MITTERNEVSRRKLCVYVCELPRCQIWLYEDAFSLHSGERIAGQPVSLAQSLFGSRNTGIASPETLVDVDPRYGHRSRL